MSKQDPGTINFSHLHEQWAKQPEVDAADKYFLVESDTFDHEDQGWGVGLYNTLEEAKLQAEKDLAEYDAENKDEADTSTEHAAGLKAFVYYNEKLVWEAGTF